MNPRGHDTLEIIAWSFLTLATVASAWCAYQAAQWNGEQSRKLARASAAQFNSVRRLAVATRNTTVDVATFLDLVAARLRGDDKLAGFLRAHARPALRPALEAWFADVEAGLADPPLPFQRPQYQLAEEGEASAFVAESQALVGEANTAIATSAFYVLHTVLFAMSLFLVGATGEAHREETRLAFLIVGATAFGATLVSALRLPKRFSVMPLARRP